MDNSKTELFESMPIPKAVVTLSVPSVISSLVMVIYSLADTFFVGMMNDPVQNAAVTLAAPLLLAFNAVNNLFGIGSSSMMSRALGRKDYDTVYRSSAFGFYASLICSLLFSLLYGVLQSPILVMLGANAETMQATADYLFWTVLLGSAPSILNVVLAYLVRAEGSSLHASIGTMCGCLLNIVLDPIFILPWGLNLGAAGAGCATCLSNTVACLYFFVLLFVKRGKTYVCIKPSMFRPSKQIVKGVCGVGIPASIQNLLNVTGMTILNNFTSAYGSDPVAAMGIMEARLEKELNNKVNRRCNCDDANTSKVVEAAQEQLAAIRMIRETGAMDKLPEKLRRAAIAREENPSASLSELAGMMEPPITKPAMGSRMRRLLELAEEVKA